MTDILNYRGDLKIKYSIDMRVSRRKFNVVALWAIQIVSWSIFAGMPYLDLPLGIITESYKNKTDKASWIVLKRLLILQTGPDNTG